MRHEDKPEVNNPKIRFPVLEGDKLMKEVRLKLMKILPQGTAADPACRDDHLQAGGRLEGRKKLGV